MPNYIEGPDHLPVAVRVRIASEEDVDAIVPYLHWLNQDADLDILDEPGTVQITQEQEAAKLARSAASDNSVVLLAWAEEMLVGMVALRGGEQSATRHSARLHISVADGWRRRGVGSLLMKAAINWAEEHETLRRVELRVFTRNQAAVELYKQHGFVQEGRLRCSICRHGALLDEYIMARLL